MPKLATSPLNVHFVLGFDLKLLPLFSFYRYVSSTIGLSCCTILFPEKMWETQPVELGKLVQLLALNDLTIQMSTKDMLHKLDFSRVFPVFFLPTKLSILIVEKNGRKNSVRIMSFFW